MGESMPHFQSGRGSRAQHRRIRAARLLHYLTHVAHHCMYTQATPPVAFTEAEKKVMTEKIQNAGTVVVEAKAGKGSATLSMVSGTVGRWGLAELSAQMLAHLLAHYMTVELRSAASGYVVAAPMSGMGLSCCSYSGMEGFDTLHADKSRHRLMSCCCT